MIGPARAARRGALLLAALLAPQISACAKVIVDHETSSGGAGGATTTTSPTTTSTEPPCACAADSDCPQGTFCEACACVQECSEHDLCPSPLMCCGGACMDLLNDVFNCGGCGLVCDAPNGVAICVDGSCGLSGCDETGYSDCDGDPENGCEVMGPCVCSPGEIAPCYSGPPDTEGVGACQSGTHTCLDGVSWSACEGEVLPDIEVCNGLDDDCDGVIDPADLDGDGWSVCDGDCCDTVACSPYPQAVNPGAFEIPGDALDDDCDPSTPDDMPFPDCGGPALQVPTTALDLVKAMDLCSFTTEDAPPPQRRWGVLSASLSLADGTGQPKDVQTGVLANYGAIALPTLSGTMAALSTGTARDEDDPDHVYPQNGPGPDQIGNFKAMTTSALPADFVAASGGLAAGACAPYQAPLPAIVHDPVMLAVKVRAPTNAGAFSFRFGFFTAEAPESVCSEYNDFFLALLDSQSPGAPADKNIALDMLGMPVAVNSAYFEWCATCVGGTSMLQGTGMGGWPGILYDGAATGWLLGAAQVVPGETIDLRFLVWDAIDGSVDSLVLLDRFVWSATVPDGAGP